MAKAKYTFNEIAACINELQDVTNKHYDSYAFSSGYLGSQLAGVLCDLPRHKQEEVMQILQAGITKYAKATS